MADPPAHAWRAPERPLGDGNPGGVSWEFLRWVWRWKGNHPDFVESVRLELGEKPLYVVRSRRKAEELPQSACQAPPRPRS